MPYLPSRIRLVTVPLLALCATQTARAQAGNSGDVATPCHQTARPEQAERAMHVLATSDATLQESLRSIGVAPQSPSAVRGVLRSTPACARLRASLRKAVRDTDMPAEGLKDAPLSFLELGDYYGVIVTSARLPVNGLRRAGAAPLYLFDRHSMAFVARLAL